MTIELELVKDQLDNKCETVYPDRLDTSLHEKVK